MRVLSLIIMELTLLLLENNNRVKWGQVLQY